MTKRTQSPAIRPMSTHGKISHIVSPSDVRSEVTVKNFRSHSLLAVLCRDAERPIHTAAMEKAATVIRTCRVVYLLNSTAFSCIRRKVSNRTVAKDRSNAYPSNTNEAKYLNHGADIADCGEDPTSERRSRSADDCGMRSQ